MSKLIKFVYIYFFIIYFFSFTKLGWGTFNKTLLTRGEMQKRLFGNT